MELDIRRSIPDRGCLLRYLPLSVCEIIACRSELLVGTFAVYFVESGSA